MKKNFFPWQLFWKFFTSIAFVINLFIAIIFVILANEYRFEILNLQNLYLFMGVNLFSIAFSALLAYRFSLPMRRVVMKALRMANKKLFYEIAKNEPDEQSLFESEPGEYFELEHALDQIRTKMKKRREQLAHEREEAKALMSSIEDAVVSVGVDGSIMFFNSGFAAQFLNAEQVHPNPQQPLLLSSVMRATEILALFDQGIKDGVGGNLLKKMATATSAEERIFSIAVVPLRDPKTKEIFEILGVFHDITELKRAERIRIEFVENASHELRTPLTSIKGYLDTLKSDIELGRFEQSKEFVHVISKNVNRLGELVNDLLVISTLEHGESPQLELIDPEEISLEVIDKLGSLAKQKSIQVNLHCQSAIQFKVDGQKLEQVLTNLIGNAIKYIPEKGMVDIFWEVSPVEKMIILKVKDNGPGIPIEHQSRLFERFYRVDKARSRDVGGTGLGLAIVKHIVLSHGGHVSVKSDAGKGTEFICQFPLKI